MLYAAGALETLGQHHAWTQRRAGQTISDKFHELWHRYTLRLTLQKRLEPSKIMPSCSQGWTRQAIKLC